MWGLGLPKSHTVENQQTFIYVSKTKELIDDSPKGRKLKQYRTDQDSNPSFFVCLFYKFIFYLYYLFLAVLGLCCCARAFSTCGEQGLLFIAVRGLLIMVASLVAEHRL